MEHINFDKPIKYNKSVSFKVEEITKEEGQKDYKIKGYASVFDVVDSYMDIMDKGCFKKSLKRSKGQFPILLNHKADNYIGINIKAKEDDNGLLIEFKLFNDDDLPKSKEAMALVKKSLEVGHPMGLSIGGYVKAAMPEKKKDKIYYRISEFDVLETSLTPLPANTSAMVESAKSLTNTIGKVLSENNTLIPPSKSSYDENSRLTMVFLKNYVDSIRVTKDKEV